MTELIQTLSTRRGRITPDATRKLIDDMALKIGCEPAVLDAIIEVESRGLAFDLKGRVIILTEKHIFDRYLNGQNRFLARDMDLATPKWSKRNYDGLGKAGSDVRWERLEDMAGIDEEAALKATSWGAPQIMGFNHKICGYERVQDFVWAMSETDTQQIKAFIAYLENVGLADDLRTKNWAGIARRYNGSGQVAYYAGLMRAAYAELAADNAPEMSKGQLLRMGAHGAGVRHLQKLLSELSYHVVVDGDFGPATKRAVVGFQVDHGLKADGIVGPQTRAMLAKTLPINQQPGNSRTHLKVSDLRQRGSQTIKHADRLSLGGWFTLLFGGASQLATIEAESGLVGSATGFARKIEETLSPLITLIGKNQSLGFLALAGFMLFLGWRIKQRRLEDAKNWKNLG